MNLSRKECPYCGKKISFFELINNKENAEYYCNVCKNRSELKMAKTIRKLIIALILSTALCILIFSFVVRMLIVGTLIINLIFVGFYLIVPRFMVLMKKQK